MPVMIGVWGEPVFAADQKPAVQYKTELLFLFFCFCKLVIGSLPVVVTTFFNKKNR